MRVGARAIAALVLGSGAYGATVATPPTGTMPPDLAAAFGARPLAWNVSLSPDGSKITYLTPSRTGGGTAVIVADLKTGKMQAVSINTKTLHPQSCRFKTETRLICVLGGVGDIIGIKLNFRNLLAIDTDGGRPKVLAANSGIFDWMPDDPGHISFGGGIRTDVLTGVRGPEDASLRRPGDVHTDSGGHVRLRASSGTPTFAGHLGSYYWYARPRDGRGDWIKVATVDLDAHSRVSVEGFDESGDNVLALMPRDGRLALMRIPIKADAQPQLVFAHPEVDVDDVLRIGKYDRPVAAVFTTETISYEYFDPELKRLSKALTKAIPGNPTVNILGESWDGAKKLVEASSDTDAGHYYLYDRDKHTLGTVATVRPALDGVPLARVEAVTYAARDGTKIPGFVTWPPGKDRRGLPAIIMPHGGPSARDARGFDWLAQFFAASGYVVLQPNFRGSSGYGDSWFAKNGFQSWPTAIGDINDGAHWVVAQDYADPRRLGIVGWSYGGYAALQANIVEPGLYRAAIAVAPVTDLGLLKEDARYLNIAPLIEAMVGSGPHVAAGSPTRRAAEIKVPVLIFSGDKDANVDIGQSRAMDAALRSAGRPHELIVYPGLDHQLDDSSARADLLRRSAAFMAQAMGGEATTTALAQPLPGTRDR